MAKRFSVLDFKARFDSKTIPELLIERDNIIRKLKYMEFTHSTVEEGLTTSQWNEVLKYLKVNYIKDVDDSGVRHIDMFTKLEPVSA